MYGVSLGHFLHGKGSWTDGSSSALLDPSSTIDGRYVHLDISRACCIVCVVVNVFDARLGDWNILYAQSWVLQLLWVVCGICFSMSQRTFVSYMGRMSLYFAIGVTANWSAWLFNGWNWAENFWSMLAQNSFVFILILIIIILAPVRTYLRRLAVQGRDLTLPLATSPQEEPEEQHLIECSSRDRAEFLQCCMILSSGIFLLAVTFVLVLRPALRDMEPLIQRHREKLGLPGVTDIRTGAEYYVEASYSLQTCLAGLWIVYCWPKLFKDKTLMAWALIVNLYIHRLVVGYGTPDLPFHGFSLFLVALTACELGMAGRKRLGGLVVRYWMVGCFLLAFLWTPGLHGDLMQQPPRDLYQRERYILIEAVFVVGWLTAGQYMVDVKIFTVDKLTWVTDSALVAFLVHQSVIWVFPREVALGFMLCIGPFCWICHRGLSGFGVQSV
mmetsp:Transcript_130729/g.279591  ORF Transcript_130729/g.279591 Transcript_130729/m.279591 type:complete len:442 (-) Transcript_130729:77-1402(-)